MNKLGIVAVGAGFVFVLAVALCLVYVVEDKEIDALKVEEDLLCVKRLDGHDYMTNVRHYRHRDPDIHIDLTCECGNRLRITQDYSEDHLIDGGLEYACARCGRIHRFKMADDGILQKEDYKPDANTEDTQFR